MRATFRSLSDWDEVRRIISCISFLGGIAEERLDGVLDYFQKVTFTAGDCIAKQGDEATHIDIIQRGRVELQIADGSQAEWCVSDVVQQ